MVGIVLVSHSKHLAQSVYNLALQAAPKATLVAVGGTGDNYEEFGTDATQIMEAIESVYSDDGVIVLMDLGSAILSTETALQLLGEEFASKTTMSSAPFVEGAIVAAVQASINASRETIVKEALGALEPKQEQLGDLPPPQPQAAEKTSIVIPTSAQSKNFTITNLHGLHARPAATFVQAISKFNAEVFVCKQTMPDKKVSAKSLNAIAKLNIRNGDTISVYAWGEDSGSVLSELEAQVLSEFGEKDIQANFYNTMQNETTTNASNLYEEEQLAQYPLLIVSRGLVIAHTYCMPSTQPIFSETITKNTARSKKDFLSALEKAKSKLTDELMTLKDVNAKEILQMHKALLEDPEIIERIITCIDKQSYNFEYATWQVCKQVAQEFQLLDNPYLQARSEDIIDIAKRVLRQSALVTLPVTNFNSISEPVILCIEEVSPDLISKLDSKIIKGIITKKGSGESHSAIIARSRDIPMLSGYHNLHEIAPDSTVILDAIKPLIIINPSKKELDEYHKIINKSKELEIVIQAKKQEKALTQDTVHIQCLANIGSIQEANVLQEHSADGVGLFRSEFLFLNRNQAPSEVDQYKVYSHTLASLNKKPVTVRILDIGGDKVIPYLPEIQEDNPFLGVRGIRLDFKYKKLLVVQLRALLRASLHGDLKIMLPFVIDELEVIQFKKIFNEVAETLTQQNISHSKNINIGIMVETPAVVFRAKQLAKHVDFFSIGTNDLTQYILAAERGNMQISNIYDHCHPSVLNAIKMICQEKNTLDISVCGEMGSDIEAIPLLIGMGIKKISLTSREIAKIKFLIRELSVQNCEALVEHALQLNSAKEIRKFVRSKLQTVDNLAGMI